MAVQMRIEVALLCVTCGFQHLSKRVIVSVDVVVPRLLIVPTVVIIPAVMSSALPATINENPKPRARTSEFSPSSSA